MIHSTVLRKNAMVDHDCSPLQMAINCSCHPLLIPDSHYILSWQPSASIWIYWHPITGCFLLFRIQVLQTPLNWRPGWLFWWLHWLWCGQPTGIVVGPVSQRVMHWKGHLSVSAIQFCLHLAERYVELWFAGVKTQRKIILNRSGKSWGIYSQLQLTMEWVTANLHVLPKISPTISSWRLQGFPTVLELAVCQSDVVRLFTGYNGGEQHPQSHFCKTWVGNYSMERTSGNVCIKKSCRSCMKQMSKPKSSCIVSITTPAVVTVQMRILLDSSWSSVPT